MGVPAAGGDGESTGVVRLNGERLTIGRGNGNDIVLDDVNVSRFHAEVVVVG